MAQKVFVSYKYLDTDVVTLYEQRYASIYTPTTVRDYVTKFQTLATQKGIIINKGERDNEDLSMLSEDTIRKNLYNRIYDSTVTIVFISPNMREYLKEEKMQWIPREISYSLRAQSRNERTSYPNSLLFVILPNHYGDYSYFNTMTHFSIVKGNIENGYGEVVKWANFINNMSYYIDRANNRRDHTPEYKIVKTI